MVPAVMRRSTPSRAWVWPKVLVTPSTLTVYVIHQLYAAYTETGKHVDVKGFRHARDHRQRRATARPGGALGTPLPRDARTARRARRGPDRRRCRPHRQRRGAGGGLDGAGGPRARLHHDVALPARAEQGRAAPADVERQRTDVGRL